MSPVPDSEPPDFLPSAPLENLKERARLLQATRSFFDERGFVEVTTSALSSETMIDTHIEPLRVTLIQDPREQAEGPTWYLQTSPEFQMKRLLAAGAERIYQIGPAFRAAESGTHHNVEFTMLEWYRCGDDMEAGMNLLADLTARLLDGTTVDRLTYGEAFWAALGLNPHNCPEEQLRKCGSALRDCRKDDRDELLHLLWNAHVENQLGLHDPVIVYDFPASQAALAKVRNDSTPVAERFELYFRGVELANGYHELTDPDEFRRRLAESNRLRVSNGKAALPDAPRQERALAAGIPPTTGVALGFDRLAMLAMGENSLQRVIPFPLDRS